METASASRTFASLGLSQPTLESIAQKGYQSPTDCQAEAIPLALAGKDLVVQSRTGTGKTAAFGIPIMEKSDPALLEVQALALVPTRELALQVAEELTGLGRGRGLKVVTIYGGDPIERQLDALRAGVHVVVDDDLLRSRGEERWLQGTEAGRLAEVEHHGHVVGRRSGGGGPAAVHDSR